MVVAYTRGVERSQMELGMKAEPRIVLTEKERRTYSSNWKAIEGMEERKQAVLAEIRARKEQHGV